MLNMSGSFGIFQYKKGTLYMYPEKECAMKTTFYDTYYNGWHHGHTADVAPAEKSSKSFRQLLADTWHSLLKVFTNAGSEPRITFCPTASGEPRWNAYDPLTGRRLYSATEKDVLIWLEKRYNYR
jgi:hypothetical protein